MIPRRFVSASLIATLLVTLAPLSARAGDKPVATASLRASIDRAVAQAAATPARDGSTTPHRRHDAPYLRRTGAGGGGGGGASKVWMAYAFVGLAGSLAGGYILYKQMHKLSSATPAQ